MPKSRPELIVFPSLHGNLRLPSGEEYVIRAERHDARQIPGEHWYKLYLSPRDKDQAVELALAQQRFDRNALRPVHFPSESKVVPGRIYLNRMPPSHRTDRNARTLIGDFWDTRSNALWTVLGSLSVRQNVLINGRLIPSKTELDFANSAIKQYAVTTGSNQGPGEQEQIGAPSEGQTASE